MPTYVRKNHRDCTLAERGRFLDALLELKKKPSPKPHPANSHGTIYGDFVAVHYDAFFSGVAHGSPNFLPWHRQFLIELEIALNRTTVARGKPFISLPYWNWIDDRDVTASPWVPDWLGGDGTGLLGQVQTGRFGVPDSRLPELLSEASMAKLRAAGKIRELPYEEGEAIWAELKTKLNELPPSRKEVWLVHQVVDERPFLIRECVLPLSESLPFHHRETEAEKEARRANEGEWFRDRGLGLLDVLDHTTYDVFASFFESDQHGMPHVALGGHMGSAGSPNDRPSGSITRSSTRFGPTGNANSAATTPMNRPTSPSPAPTAPSATRTFSAPGPPTRPKPSSTPPTSTTPKPAESATPTADPSRHRTFRRCRAS